MWISAKALYADSQWQDQGEKRFKKRSPPQSDGPANYSLKKIYQTTQRNEGYAQHIPEKTVTTDNKPGDFCPYLQPIQRAVICS
ncbi:MAG: hypothetical protein E7J63_18095 [Pantoea sp.]|uniref:hypothetical protein n=1 Tax=Pantoea TaxID=53335 RepID=UPI002892F8B8|nr:MULTISPECIES: hypothetical protein [Pantoea]MCG7391185.1 hypothetical protein [Pantoea sp. ACRSB]MDU6435059.1 hypothetical protein [Pantoea sp.]MDU6442266.1 hypothetical protein [Pantoea sp.]MDU7840203.1 hypothetical protein [Pantoea sp.]